MSKKILKADIDVIESTLNYRNNTPREKQKPPDTDWFVWLIRAGRGFGKTFSGSRWLHSKALKDPGCWMALIGKTPGDVRDDCIEGPGGILNQQPPEVVQNGGVNYEPSKRRIQWPNESYATIYSGANHDQIRGFSGSFAWCDEFAAWEYPVKAWDNLMFGMREGQDPQICITTTPKPIEIIQEIEDEESTVTVTGSTYENEENLNDQFLETIESRYEGTTKGQQEIHAEYIDRSGALWSYDIIEHRDSEPNMSDLSRIVVAIDPAVTSNKDSDETGIVAVGEKRDGDYTVIEDATIKGSPSEWANEAVALYKELEADRIIAETNQGGDMVEKMIRQVDRDVSYEEVKATRGKVLRAEPIVALYENGRVEHARQFDKLESQMVRYAGEKTSESPDRMDSLVWGLTYLTNDDGPTSLTW